MRTIEKYLWKDDVMNVVFISGPHGCGKTAFMEALLEKSEVYIKDSFFLDFVNDLPAISHMSIFEKCLLRLYHRFYTAQQANLKCKKNNDNKILLVDRSIYDSIVYNTVEHDMETLSSMTIFEKCLIRLYHRFYTAELAIKKCGMSKENDKILVVDRSIYDSLVYIEVEYKLGELSDEQYHKLREIVDNSLAMIEPYTVVLNPNPEEIVRRLEIRRATGTRKKRDQMCAREDNVDYVGKMNDEFIKIYSNKNVININNNEDEDIKKINDWINGTVLAQSKPF